MQQQVRAGKFELKSPQCVFVGKLIEHADIGLQHFARCRRHGLDSDEETHLADPCRRNHVFRAVSTGFRVLWCRGMNLAGIPGWFLSGRVLKRRQLSAAQVRLYDRLVPLFRLEDRLPLPVAMNLTACAVADR